MKPQAGAARDAFERASEARRRDVHSADGAAALTDARAALERALAEVLARVPYRARRVGDLRPGRDGGHVHLACSTTPPSRIGAAAAARRCAAPPPAAPPPTAP